ncbi:MAG: hydroxyacid dehydrogenase [Opitutaceae bacterium]|nr:hydroxyacid dehydrogenase [Opitutaceae bacterium]
MKPDILITERITGPWVDALSEDFAVHAEPELWKSPDLLAKRIVDCRALIVRNQTRVTAELIAAAPRLQVIGRAGAGLDNVDVHAASAAGVVVVSTPDQNSLSVAELVLAMMFALARQLTVADRSTKQGGWERQKFTGIELSGKTLGLVGLGRIGFLTGLRARALGMRVIAHDAFVSPDAAAVTETQAELVPLDDLLARSDFVSCHVPLTSQTRRMFAYERFCQMKPSAYFLNLARGELVDEAGLNRALDEGRLAGAALDVREQEPPGPSLLSARDNVILTPHIAAFTREGQARVVAAICRDVASVLNGETPRNPANFPRPRAGSRI